VEKLGVKPNDGDKVVFFKPVGCPVCSNTGYRGRLALHEVLFMTPAVKDLVTSKASADQIESVALQDGMMTLRQDGLRKVALGLTSLEEVMRAVFVAEDSE